MWQIYGTEGIALTRGDLVFEKRIAFRDHHSDVNSVQPEVSRGHSSYGNEPRKKKPRRTHKWQRAEH